MNIIDFENINVGYDSKIILKDITLKIKEKEHWAILGANGSGKSTLMKLIQSEIHPRKTNPYKKEILGKSNYSILSGHYSSIGVFKHQDFSESQHEKAKETMKYLEIEHLANKYVQEMSTGELRKCIVARALIHDPKAFILDEPTVGLDIKAQINFIKMIQKLSKNCSIILVTHHLEEIFEKIKNVALIYDNTIYKSKKKEDILTSQNLSEIFDTNIHINMKNNRYFVEEIF